MKISALRVPCVAAMLFATSARAQGTPPFDLSAPASSSQIVEMELNAEDPQELTNPVRTVEISSTGEERLVRDQRGTGAGNGSLHMFPGSTNYLIFPFQGPPVGGTTLIDDGSRSFIVSEFPVVVGGSFAPFFQIGEHFFHVSCPGASCSGYLEGSILSDAESGFDLPVGTLDVNIEASTPDYGLDGPGVVRHRIDASASAALQDWVYVTGEEGATATIVMSATLDVSIDAPIPRPSPVCSRTG